MRHSFPRLLVLLVSVAPVATLRADDAGNEFFEKKIRPILVQHCYECHSAAAGDSAAHRSTGGEA